MNSAASAPELDHLRHILVRDLGALAEEVKSTPESALWRSVDGVTNSVGTLAVHLCGNLEHFIGHEIGQNGYQRDREAEFSGQPIPKASLISSIRHAQATVESVLGQLELHRLDEEMPHPPPHHAGSSIRFFLMQLSCHLSRHMGQANYLRRILAAD
ncbi:MAG: DUF664 domain-containing protein [Flavobacteriales bacterium]|nr:DUF664 domain-containing protein [Flavobacteriales bacterium]